MLKNKYIYLAFVLSMIALASCSDIGSRLDELEPRVLALEETISKVNDNAISMQKLMDESIVITSYTTDENGYTLTLNDGSVISIFYGALAPSIVPIVGVDKKGNWIISIDGGKTFSEVDKSLNVNENDGVIPRISIDKDGYWIISYDKGKTFSQILNSEGLPMSAVDAKETVGGYSFFSNVTIDEDASQLVVRLVTGEELLVPIVPAGSIVVKNFVQKENIYAGETLTFECTLVDVASATWKSIPEGWAARLTDSEITFIAGNDSQPGEYTFQLLSFSKSGLGKISDFTFTLSPYIFEDNFDKGDIPDPNRWELCKKKYETGWSSCMSESYDNAYIKDGKLVLMADIKDGVKRSGGIQTKFGFEKCRVELSARFSKCSQGVLSAAWLFPYSRYVWPDGGEVDIYEHLNHNNNLWMTCHSHYTVNLGKDPDAKHKKVNIDPSVFNTYAIDLTEDAVIFYLNNKEVFRYANEKLADEETMKQYPFYKSDFYLLLDCCLGMEWPGEVIEEQLPAYTEIDWIKISKLN